MAEVDFPPLASAIGFKWRAVEALKTDASAALPSLPSADLPPAAA
jgi:hypothetical protein